MNRTLLASTLLAWPLLGLAAEPEPPAAPSAEPAPLIAAPPTTSTQPAAPAAPAFDFRAYEEARARTRLKVDEAQVEYESAQAALLTAAGVPAGQVPAAGKAWPQAELDAYLSAALMLIGAGLEYQSVSNQTLPYVLTPGSMQGWLKQWPGNPLNGWQPIRVMPDAGTSWPGDIIWMLSSAEHYTAVNSRVHPGPYTLTIYGAPQPGAKDGVAVAAINSAPDAGPGSPLGPAQQAQAADEAWMRAKALAWAAAQPVSADPKQQQLMLRSLPELLRTARRVDKLASELKARPREQWKPEQQTEYLQQALWLVYTGMNAASWAGLDTTPWLAGKPNPSLLPYWPGNPYAGWAPMQIKDGAYGLKNGDFYLEQSPAYYAMLGSNGSLVNSYQMYVLGPGSKDAAILPPDKSNVWAGPPPAGAVGSLGISTTPLLSSEFNRAICHS